MSVAAGLNGPSNFTLRSTRSMRRGGSSCRTAKAFTRLRDCAPIKTPALLRLRIAGARASRNLSAPNVPPRRSAQAAFARPPRSASTVHRVQRRPPSRPSAHPTASPKTAACRTPFTLASLANALDVRLADVVHRLVDRLRAPQNELDQGFAVAGHLLFAEPQNRRHVDLRAGR